MLDLTQGVFSPPLSLSLSSLSLFLSLSLSLSVGVLECAYERVFHQISSPFWKEEKEQQQQQRWKQQLDVNFTHILLGSDINVNFS